MATAFGVKPSQCPSGSSSQGPSHKARHKARRNARRNDIILKYANMKYMDILKIQNNEHI